MPPDQLSLDLHQSTRRSRRTAAAPSTVPRVALGVEEAAQALGVSRDYFERHILGRLRVIYSGRRRLIPAKELERWADREAIVPRNLSRP